MADAALVNLDELDHNADWIKRVTRQREARERAAGSGSAGPALMVQKAYNPAEPRDARGEWTDGGPPAAPAAPPPPPQRPPMPPGPAQKPRDAAQAASALLEQRIIDSFFVPDGTARQALYERYSDGTAKPVLVMMLGSPGCGKSTVANREFLRLHNFVNIDPDRVKQQLPGYDPKHPEAVHARSMAISARILERALREGKPTLVDGTGSNEVRYQKIVADARARGYHIAMCLVDAPLETCLARNRARERSIADDVVVDLHRQVAENWPELKKLADHAVVVHNV